MNRQLFVSLVLGLSAAVACAQVENEDHKKLQGIWKAVAFEEDGKEAKPNGPGARLLEGMSWEFKGDQCVCRMEGQIEFHGTFKIDPGKNTKEIDVYDSKRKLELVGIYELQGNNLKIRLNNKADGRPKTFTTMEGTHDQFLFVLERSKK
ncbi:MAG: TIGR03067 domain-containing protein [Nitrospira sp.]|nr:TIGR03067 domain-containing protein [Nitrospira sp.]